MWIDAHEGKAYGMFAFSLGQPVECIIALAKQPIDDRDFVSRHPLLLSPLEDFLQDHARLIMPANRGQQVRALRVRSRRIAREYPLLFEGSQRFMGHSFSFVGPAQDRVSSYGARVKLECLTTLLDRIIKSACKKENVGD